MGKQEFFRKCRKNSITEKSAVEKLLEKIMAKIVVSICKLVWTKTENRKSGKINNSGCKLNFELSGLRAYKNKTSKDAAWFNLCSEIISGYKIFNLMTPKHHFWTIYKNYYRCSEESLSYSRTKLAISSVSMISQLLKSLHIYIWKQGIYIRRRWIYSRSHFALERIQLYLLH